MTNPLFTPFDMAGLHLPNRIVMAPMTRSFSPGGVPGANVAEYYRRRAEGSVGLIVTEGTGVDRAGSLNDPNVPVFHGEAALGGWGTVVEAVHAGGGRIAPQLWHVGGMKNPMLPDHPHAAEGPSGLLRPGKEYGTAMTDADIADTVQAFASAAADAVRLGFDAVELHGAHGYLIDQFFWDGTNVRDDGWNGTLPERARFAAHIVRAVKGAIGTTPLILRLSQWKQQDFTARLAATPDALAAWLTPLAEAGVDVFHCSQRRFWEPEFADVDGDDGLNFAGWAKKLTAKPTITVGSVGLSNEFVASFGGEGSKPASLDNLLHRLDRDEFDLVAVGRALIVDPDWAEKVRDGRMADLKDFDRGALATLV